MGRKVHYYFLIASSFFTGNPNLLLWPGLRLLFPNETDYIVKTFLPG
jgi:hypothetical protein